MAFFDFFSDEDPKANNNLKTDTLPSFEDWFKEALSKHIHIQPSETDKIDEKWLEDAFWKGYYPSPSFNWRDFDDNNMERFFSPGVIKSTYLSIIKQLGDTQQELSNILENDEKLILITPLLPGYSETDLSLKGLAVITNKRLFLFTNNIISQLHYSDIEDVKTAKDLGDGSNTIGIMGGDNNNGIYCPVIIFHKKTLIKMPLDGYSLDINANTMMKEMGPFLMILTSTSDLRDEFIGTLKRAFADTTVHHPSDKVSASTIKDDKQMKSLIELLSEYVEIMKDVAAGQRRGEMDVPEATRDHQIDLDNKIHAFISSARKSSDYITISEAQAHLSKLAQEAPPDVLIMPYSHRIFGTFLKHAKRDTLEDMIDNCVKAYTIPLVAMMSNEELQELFNELTDASVNAIKAKNYDALARAQKYLLLDSTTENILEGMRDDYKKALSSALAGNYVTYEIVW